MANTSITTSVGQQAVNSSAVLFMREIPVEFYAENLRPGRTAQFFFGDTNVTRFVQKASKLVPDTANANSALSAVIEVNEQLWCNTTYAYATALGASNGTIYLNENYITVTVNTVGANSFTATSYSPGDILYQNPTLANGNVANVTFEAEVAYWNNSLKILALLPITGTLGGPGTWLYKSGKDQVCNTVSEIWGNKFPLNGVVSSLDNVANRFLVKTYEHNSGIVFNNKNGIQNGYLPNSNCISLSGNITSSMIGNLIFMTSGTGLGQGAQILAINTSAGYVVTNTAFSPTQTGNTTYSIGNNSPDFTGHIYGVFHIPETQTINFPVGTQVFTITDSIIVDDPNATMCAQANFVAQGYLGSGTSDSTVPVVQPSNYTQPASGVTSSSIGGGVSDQVSASAAAGPNNTYSGIISANGATTWPWAGFSVDPIAQTFLTPAPDTSKSNYGIFISSIDLWFNAAPEGSSPQFPVQVLICETNNGVPVANVLGIATVSFEDIIVTATPDSINIGPSLIANNKTVTKFAFDDPVYLQPSTTYALVLYTESPDYEVYIAAVGNTDISTGGSNNTSRISTTPSIGNFFKSQNSTAWTPIQNEMLMFVLNKAVFSTEPVTMTFNVQPSSTGTNILPYDTLLLNSSDLNFSVSDLTYDVQTFLANTFGPDTYQQVTPGTTLNWSQDLKTSQLNSTRRRVVLPGNSQSVQVEVSMQTNDPDVSPVINPTRLSALLDTFIINAGGLTSRNITITNPGNHINAANIVVTIGAPDLADGTQATANVPVLNGNSVPFVQVTYPGSGYSVAPTITISEPGAPANATAAVAGENAPSGGNGMARYVTRQITLATGMDAGDLRVWLNCVRPSGTDIEVYYKVLSSTDSTPFTQVPWQEMALVSDINSPDQVTPIQLQYCPALGPNGLPSGQLSYVIDGTQYPLGGTFNSYAIKIVLLAEDPSVSPIVQSLQAIAYPAG